MRCTIPVPLHGWRAFFGEVGIIILGVLAALAAQQFVENVQMQDAADQLRASMRRELSDNRARWRQNHERYACAVKFLDDMDAWFRTAPPEATMRQTGYGGLWHTHVSAWAVASASPAQVYLPLEERNLFAETYQVLDRQQMTIFAASDSARRVAALAQVADDGESRRQLRFAIAETRVALRQLDANYEFLERRFDKLGIQPEASGIDQQKTLFVLCPRFEA